MGAAVPMVANPRRGVMRTVALAASLVIGACVGIGKTAEADASFTGLGDLPGGGFGSSASAVSADGSAVVGGGTTPGTAGEAFRWTAGGGMAGLGDLPGGSFRSRASGISADGSVVVGTGQSGGGEE